MESNQSLNLSRDLAYVEAMAAELKNYLLSDILYWSISARDYTLPKGTLGGLLLRLHRLHGLYDQLTPAQQTRVDGAERAVTAELDQWTVQAEEKALRAIRARYESWRQYLNELGDEPDRYASEYPTQAEGRTDLELLLELAGDAVDARVETQIFALDQITRGLTEKVGFIWDEEMQAAFPEERFWWLYALPKHGDS